MFKNKGAFLDRDGPIIVDTGYISDPELVRLSPGAIEAITTLKERGYIIIVISNQAGVGSGLITPDQASVVHDRMIHLLSEHNVYLDDVYYCYHAKGDGCACRKPNPTYVHEAAQKYNIDLSKSFFAGDRPSDLKTGRNAHSEMKTILVGEKEREPLFPSDDHLADYKASDLKDAVEWFLSIK